MSQAVENAVETLNPSGRGQVVILCEHASNHIPPRYADLGLSAEDKTSHAAWDPGAREVCLKLSAALDAPVVASKISRLVYDCNRPPERSDAITPHSELIDVPGNQGLSESDRAERIEAVYQPFLSEVDAVLDQRQADSVPTALVTIHSFNPTFFGEPRDVEIGILHDKDSALADAMLTHAGVLSHRNIERNQPYGPEDGVTHSLIEHGLKRQLPNVMIEVRNDLIADEEGVTTLSAELLQLLEPALLSLGKRASQNA